VVATDGSWSMVCELKGVENNSGVSSNATKAAKQIINAPATEKWIIIEVANGTWEEFQREGREKGIGTIFKSQYPNIKLRVRFSDHTQKEW
jgi:hypothetical protein